MRPLTKYLIRIKPVSINPQNKSHNGTHYGSCTKLLTLSPPTKQDTLTDLSYSWELMYSPHPPTPRRPKKKPNNQPKLHQSNKVLEYACILSLSTGLITRAVSQCVTVWKINRSPIVIHRISESLCISLRSQILQSNQVKRSRR